MKKLGFDILAVGTLFVLINFLCYQYITYNLLFDEYERPLEQNFTGYNKFIFSDSHGWSITKNKIDVENILKEHGIYNMSYGSDSYGDILVKIKWLINSGVKVDTIFLSIDDHMLSKAMNNSFRTVSFVTPALFNEIYFKNKWMYYYYSLAKYFPLIYPSNQQLIQKFLLSKISDNSNEVTWDEMDNNQRILAARKRKRIFFKEYGNVKNEKLKNNLMEIVSFLELNKVEVIGLKFPISNEMIDEISTYSGIVEMELLKNIEVLDYTKLLEEAIYFANQDHVNELGARVFCNQFLKNIK